LIRPFSEAAGHCVWAYAKQAQQLAAEPVCGDVAQEFGKHGDEWHRLYAGFPSGPTKINAVELNEPVAPFEMMCGLLVPLYTARATEEVFYGRRGVTLQTSKEVTFALSWITRL
jgi:hypothetical protein